MKTNNMQPKHTPGPWVAELSTVYPKMQDWEAQDNADPICSVINRADAAFIVRACNSHEILVRALRDICRHQEILS